MLSGVHCRVTRASARCNPDSLQRSTATVVAASTYGASYYCALGRTRRARANLRFGIKFIKKEQRKRRHGPPGVVPADYIQWLREVRVELQAVRRTLSCPAGVVTTSTTSTTATTMLRVPHCGDGIRDPGELCDDGNQGAGDGCRSDCLPPECTAGIIDPHSGCASSSGRPCDEIPDQCEAARGTQCTITSTELREVVDFLAACEQEGRDNGTPGSERVQDFLVTRLQQFALGGAADGSFRQPFTKGTNLIARLPGRDPGVREVLMVGAHYDGLGSDASGATDNATGVAVVLAIGRALARLPVPPLRTVLLVLWDAEEDGLLGSTAYVANPVVPLSDVTAYVNFDLVGSSPLRGWRRRTLILGLDTGLGLRDLVTPLLGDDALILSPLGVAGERSDQQTFVTREVPVLFFTDASSGCYHTASDDIGNVHFGKALRTAWLAYRMTLALAEASVRPTFAATIVPTYPDVVTLRDMLRDGLCEAEASGMTPDQVTQVASWLRQMDALVEAGTVTAAQALQATLMFRDAVTLITQLPCQRN